jgi:glucose/arabinose dehydrogenase
MRTVHFIAIFALVAVMILNAGCTSNDSGHVGLPPSGATQNTLASPVEITDLTNQNSSLAATFVNSASGTRLQPGTQPVSLRLVADGFDAPMMIAGANDTSGRMFVVDQTGVVKIIHPDGTVGPLPFLDIRDRMIPLTGTYDEGGLLSIAFHPDYRNNGRVFVYYSAPLRLGAPIGWDSTIHLSEFRVSATNPDMVDPGTEKVLLTIDKPSSNHNGGPLFFGPDDGYLYFMTGDGGGANDAGLGHNPVTGNGQDLSTLLGKVSRIDVDHVPPGKTYGIPADNPFAGDSAARPEIFAYGLRNPAFASVDSGSGHHLFIANAGQALFESAYIILKGGDYGWHIREGTHCFDPANSNLPPARCPVTGPRGEPLIGPIVELGHDIGNTIVGGAIYRGSSLTGWQGKYVSGTWTKGFGPSGDGTLLVSTPPAGFDTGSLQADASLLTTDQNRMWTTQQISVAGSTNGRINKFVRGINEGPDHELYVLVNNYLGPGTPGSGEIWKMVPA